MVRRDILVATALTTLACQTPVRSVCDDAPRASPTASGSGVAAHATMHDSSGNARAVSAERERLKRIADVAAAARDQLVKDRSLSPTLAADLDDVDVRFDAKSLDAVSLGDLDGPGRSALVDLLVGATRIDERKRAVLQLLANRSRLDDELGGRPSITHAVLFGGPKDPAGNWYGILAPLATPIPVPNASALTLPDELVVIHPITKSRVTAPRYKGGSGEKPAALYMIPKSTVAACPPSNAGGVAELTTLLTQIVDEIRGTGGTPALLARADAVLAGPLRREK